MCLSETYLDSNILPDDSNLEIPGYNLVRSDHPSNKNMEVLTMITMNNLQDLYGNTKEMNNL